MNPTQQNTVPSTPKSATAAGLLGIFLGAFGAHNWYLGQKQKGIIHLCLIGGAILLTIIGSIMTSAGVATSIYSYRVSGGSAALAVIGGILAFIGGLANVGNGIWGLVEGIMILVKGDAGLAAQGYTVAAPVVYQQPAQPAQPAAPATPAPEAKSEEKSSEKSDDKKAA